LATRTEDSDTLCPVSRSTALIGDRWSLLVIRELFMGVSRFVDLQAQTGATPQMLTARLKRLEADGLVQKRPSATEPRRHEYALTEKGAGLLPVLLALRSWGERWCKSAEEGVALRTTHRTCGAEVGVDGVCHTCARPVAWSELAAAPTAHYIEERRSRAAQFRATTPSAPSR
jgi:DNA-binding HxlR family transcriptional regulator